MAKKFEFKKSKGAQLGEALGAAGMAYMAGRAGGLWGGADNPASGVDQMNAFDTGDMSAAMAKAPAVAPVQTAPTAPAPSVAETSTNAKLIHQNFAKLPDVNVADTKLAERVPAPPPAAPVAVTQPPTRGFQASPGTEHVLGTPSGLAMRLEQTRPAPTPAEILMLQRRDQRAALAARPNAVGISAFERKADGGKVGGVGRSFPKKTGMACGGKVK